MGKSKRFAALALVAAFGLVAASCGDDEKTENTSGDTSGPTTTVKCPDPIKFSGSGDIKFGLAFDTGGRGDGTFNDSAAEGADKAVTDLGVTKDELEATKAEDRKANLETLSSNGDNPIIAVGFAFGDSLKAVAEANPNTSYAIVDGFIPCAPGNVTFLGFAARGFVPRRCCGRAEEQGWQDRFHRRPGDRPHQEVRGRVHRWCEADQPRHRGKGAVPRPGR